MNDKQKLIQMLLDFGVSFKEQRCKNARGWNDGVEFGNSLYGEWDESNKVDGYSGFFTQFEFDENGKFVCVGAWE